MNNNWQEKFDNKFKGQVDALDYLRMLEGDKIDLAKWMYTRDYAIKDYISQLIEEVQEETLRELTRRGVTPEQKMSEILAARQLNPSSNNAG